MGDKKSVKNLTEEELALLSTEAGLAELLSQSRPGLEKTLDTLRYLADLEALQIELISLQRSVAEKGRRVAILFEGRDAAGKGGCIRRFVEHLAPRSHRVVALPKPTDIERGQWYFSRYIAHLPDPGEIVFFDRSWYNRAVVEPVMGFCTDDEYHRFLQHVPALESMLIEDGLELVKFWLDISKDEQAERFAARRMSPLKQWKLSPIDEKAQQLWDSYSQHRDAMFEVTATEFAPWTVVETDSKKTARLSAMRYVLNTLDYDRDTRSPLPKLELDSDVVTVISPP